LIIICKLRLKVGNKLRNLKKVSIFRLILIGSTFSLLANCVHPITPTLFVNLNFPDYMFGVAFATMSIAVSLSSPLWGRLGSKIGYVKIMLLGIPGYGLGQLIFGIAKTPFIALVGRFVAGWFSAAVFVAIMAYTVNITTNENRSKYMSYYAAFSSFAGAMGYLVGGLLGDISIKLTFYVQVVSTLVLTLIAALILGESSNTSTYVYDINKSVTVNKKGIYTTALVTFLVGVFICSFATTAYDNAFNYYIKAELDFPASYNGIIKAVIGIIGLTANFTINIYIIKNTNVRKSIIFILLLCGISTFAVPFIPSVLYFILGNIVFFTFNAMYIPIQQALATMNVNKNDSGVISGVFNSITSAGRIAGALFAGFAYSFGSKIPFFAASIAFLLAVLVSTYNYRQHKSIN